jgi:hypothetical protein
MLTLSSAYSKQKTPLKSELEGFLFSLPGEKSLCTAMPVDVCRFLAWKDQNGKTKIHQVNCVYPIKLFILISENCVLFASERILKSCYLGATTGPGYAQAGNAIICQQTFIAGTPS